MQGKLSDILKQYEKRLDEIGKKVFVELSAQIYDDNPKDTWNSANNWAVGINSWSTVGVGGNFPGAVGGAKAGDLLTNLNDTAYIRVLEYTGHSPQAPNGFFWPAVSRYNHIVITQARVVANGV